MFDYKKMVLSAFKTYEDDMYNLLVTLERYNVQNNESEAWTYTYTFPRPNSRLAIRCGENGCVNMALLTPEGTFHMGGTERNVREMQKQASHLHEMMEKYHLNFCPRHTEEFRQIVKNADVGTVISLNTGRMISCIDKQGLTVVFQDCFAGNIDDLTLDSFRQGRVFPVETNDPEAIQDLFEYAYNRRTLTANIRVAMNSTHGAYAVTDIENRVKDNEAYSVHVGPIHLKVCDFNGKKVWYDNNNHKIERSIVENLFGWVQLSIPDIKIKRPVDFILEDKVQDQQFLHTVQQMLATRDFRQVAEFATQYAIQNKRPATLTIKGFSPDGTGSYDLTSYSFHENRITKVIYEQLDEWNQPIPLRTEMVAVGDFEEFCERAYDSSVQFLETEYSKQIEKLPPDVLKDRTGKELVSILMEQHKQQTKPVIQVEEMDQIKESLNLLINTAIEPGTFSAEEMFRDEERQ